MANGVPDFAVTEIIIDSSQAVIGADQADAAFDKLMEGSKGAAAAVDNLGEKIDTTSSKLELSRRQLNAQEAALRTQSAAAGGSAAALLEAEKQTTSLGLAQAAVTRRIMEGTISVQAGNAELALLGGRQSTVAATAAKLQTGTIAAADAMAVLKGSSIETAVAAEGLAVAHGHVTGSAAKMREGLVIVHELLTGNYKRAFGSGTIEMQNFFGAQGLVTLATNPLVIGLVTLTATMVGLAIAGAEFDKSFAAVSVAMKLTGDASGVTRGQLEQLAQSQAASAGVSVKSYREIEAAIIRTGDVGAENFAKIASISATMAQATGEDAAKMAEEITRAVTDPAKGVEELDKKYRLFTATQLEEIEAATKSGDAHKAGALILADMQPRMEQLSADLAAQVGWWGKLKIAASDFFDKIGSIGKQNTLEQTLAVDTAQLTVLQERLSHLQSVGRGDEGASLEKLIALQQVKVNLDQQDVAEAQAAADHRAKDKSIDEQQKSVDKLVKSIQEQTDQLGLQVQGFDTSKAHQLALKLAYDLQADGIDKLTESQKQQLITAAANQIAAQQNLDDLDAQKKAAKDWAKELEHMTKVGEEARLAQEHAHQSIADQILKLQEQSEQYDISARQKTIDVELTKAQETAQRAHTTVTAEETQAIIAQVNHLYDSKDAHDAAAKAAEEYKKQQKELAREIEHTTNQIVDEGAKLFDDAFFSKSTNRWKTFIDDIAKMLEKFFSQMAAEALLRPIVQPIVTEFFGSGAGGLVSNAANGANGSSGGGLSSLSNLPVGSVLNSGGGGLFSGASNYLFGGVTGNAETGLGQVTSGAVPGFSGGYFGGMTTINPETGLAFNSGGVSLGTIGTAFGGIAGIAGGIAGLAGGRQNTIGTAASVGQIAGGGVALASTLIPALAAAGPYGLAIAAVLAVVSSLFGNAKPHNISGLDINSVGAGGDLSPLAVGNDNGANTGQLQDLLTGGAQPFLQSLSKKFGADLSGVNIGAFSHKTEGKDDFSIGFTGPVPGQSFAIDPNDKTGASVNDALTHLGLALLQSASKVDDADAAFARFNIDINDTADNINKALGFVTNFRAALDALTTGSGFDINKSIIGKAQNDATALFGQIKDFLDQTNKLFANGSQVKDAQAAVKSYVEMLIGLKQPVDSTLTVIEVAVKTLKANIDALKPVFDQVGISAEEAQKALANGMAVLKKQVNDSVQFQIDQIQRPGFAQAEQALSTVAANFVANTKDAVATGADQAKVYQLALLQAGAAMKTLSQEDLADLERMFIGSAPVFQAASQQMQAASASTAVAMSAIVDSAQQMAAGLNASAASIKATIESLLVGPLTALSPKDQLAEAQRQFSTSPDQATAQTLLQLGQSFYGGATANYAGLFHSVLFGLAQAGAADASRAATMPASVLASLNGGGVDSSAGDAAAANFLNSLPHFDKGGVVGGPMGSPQLIVAHSGERITPANDNGLHAVAARLDAVVARLDALHGATVQGSDKVARAVKPTLTPRHTRKTGTD